MADTAVALASGNVKLVSSKVVTFPLPSDFLFVTSHFKVKPKVFYNKTFFQLPCILNSSTLQVIGRMCKIIDKTCLSPTPTLEQHLMWDDIAILARYMLMLSFNNSLDVAAHLPYLFHVVTFLVATGPLSLRASTHGLVINIIHSLCTCSQLHFSGKFQKSNLCFTTSFLHFMSPEWHRLSYCSLWYFNPNLLI